MKIQSYEIYNVTIPTRRKHVWATSTVSPGNCYMILKLVSDTGVEGWGESTAMPEWGGDFGRYYGEDARTSQVVFENHLFPAIVDMDPMNMALIHRKMDKAIRGYPYAKTAVVMALYDMLGKELNRPVCDLLGGRFRDRIELAHSLGLMEVDAAVEEGRKVVAEGIRNLKVKGGHDLKRDLEVVRKLREAVGPNVHIVLDPNQAYPSAKEAVKVCTEMNQYDLYYVEQPVEGMLNMEKVTSNLNIPVCADESCWTPADALDLIRHNGCDFFSIYTAKAGGMYRARQIASIAEWAGIRCNVNGSGEFGIGNAANLHLAAASPAVTLPSMILVSSIAGKELTQVAGRLFIDDIIKYPFDYDDGYLKVPEGPGLGIEIDMEKIQKYASKS